MKCATCERDATCFGVYEDPANPIQPACDECCGHGKEDGWCRPIDELMQHMNELRDADHSISDQLAEAQEGASALKEALIAAMIPLEALSIARGDQFSPEVSAAVVKARALALRALLPVT